ncbi:MAG: hxuB 1 [Sporomusa sp.]|jgi:hemolysin activation/secretion protein|nr:hxuB 1 [Sporomusa sp.]
MRKIVSYHIKKMCPLAAAVCLLLTTPVSAALPEQNDNSTMLGGIKEHTLPPQEQVKPQIEVKQKEPAMPAQSDQTKIHVEKISITGQALYSEADLQPLIKDAYGKELTLGELEVYARRITQYFREQGYLVARAVIPAQTIENGAVTIQVLIGQYDQIQVQNDSALRQTAIDRVLSPLKNGDYIQKETLERTLLLLSATDGISSKATLTAGGTPSTSNLVISLTDTAKATGQAYIDNHGSRYTGKNRFGFNYNLHNLSGEGDTLSLGAILGKDMDDYSLSYQLPTGGGGAKLGIGYSRSHYTLGETFADLDASGIAKTTSIYESVTLRRSRDLNLTGRIGFDHKDLEDRINYFGSNSRKSADIWKLGVSGDSRDNMGGGGYNSFGLTFSLGQLDMDSPDAVTNDSSAHTAGHYNKTNLNLYRIQSVNNRLNLHLSFAGQLASKNLDSSEKISLGGPSGVRAYPVNEASGDEGYVATGELRWNLPDPRVQLTAFVDGGHVTLNKSPWTKDANSRTLSGAGLGFIFSRPGDYALRLDYAWKLSSSEAVSDTDRAGRFWLQGVKYF